MKKLITVLFSLGALNSYANSYECNLKTYAEEVWDETTQEMVQTQKIVVPKVEIKLGEDKVIRDNQGRNARIRLIDGLQHSPGPQSPYKGMNLLTVRFDGGNTESVFAGTAVEKNAKQISVLTYDSKRFINISCKKK